MERSLFLGLRGLLRSWVEVLFVWMYILECMFFYKLS